MSSTDKHLIVLCGNFPFGFGEPFLEVEFAYLKEYFQKITICTTSLEDEHSELHFEIPEGVQLINLNPEISLSEKIFGMFRLITDEEMRDEMNVIQTSYHSHVNWGKLKTMLVSKLRALKLKVSLQKLFDESDIDTYLYSYWTDDAALAIAYLKRDKPTVTAFSRIHGWDLYFERSVHYYLPFRKLIFNGLDAVFPISENGRNYLLSHFDTIINRGRVYQSRLGIRTVDALPPQNRKFRRFRLVSCSNLIPIKRVELIIRALSSIEELEIDWTHFGDGTEESSVRALASQLLDAKENVEYHFPGRIPNWKVLEYYSDHTVDLFITLSRYDGIPVSIMEAMSFGIPALATDVGGVSEIVINEKTGFLLDQEVNPKDVAEVIETVAEMDADQYDAMRAEAKNMWGTFYSADVNYPEFCKKILSLREG